MGIRHKIGRDKKIVFVRAPGRERERERVQGELSSAHQQG